MCPVKPGFGLGALATVLEEDLEEGNINRSGRGF